jgi:hypothetical protein
VELLLHRLGYFDDLFYVFPQLRLQLRVTAGVESQLIAELIALYQAHDFTVENKGATTTTTASATMRPLVVGVRVNGFHLWFYQIDDPQHLLDAMTSKLAANEWTTVSKPNERTIIILAL